MKKILLTLMVFTGLLQISCSEDLVDTDTPTNNSVDVYVAGQKNSQACYWKNNQLVLLDSGGITAPTANKIIVANNDVYVLGIGVGTTTTETFPMFWKNGVLTNLKTSLSTDGEEVMAITDFEVAGNDVYFVGYTKRRIITFEDYSLAYWKNGVKTVVRDYGAYVQNYPKIKAVNNTVYIAASNTGALTLNGYYTNNVFTEIPFATLTGLAKNNNEVYAYGTANSGGYYKNITTGTETSFPAVAAISSMFFENNNVYLTDVASIYKNGVLHDAGQPQLGGIMDFKILNNNTYKITQVGIDSYISYLTINGVEAAELPDSQGTFLSLFVVQN
ncbi:hypothetical protein GGR22_001859 [Flavobacterium gossypii]|uniref:DUF5074 domain-containing protein n=1 Tax=Flavobacterium gossypii TaxID=1646119 RepID=A0ABR6DQN2_9FLAO|nr:hypothetical protein [Flavobacterium gossypii]MBA9073733.1 hypothetical protein [Flavobacterium gossypii]